MGNQSPISTASVDEKLAQIQSLLGHMQELAVQAASGECTPVQCAELQAELVRLHTEIEYITGSPV